MLADSAASLNRSAGWPSGLGESIVPSRPFTRPREQGLMCHSGTSLTLTLQPSVRLATPLNIHILCKASQTSAPAAGAPRDETMRTALAARDPNSFPAHACRVLPPRCLDTPRHPLPIPLPTAPSGSAGPATAGPATHHADTRAIQWRVRRPPRSHPRTSPCDRVDHSTSGGAEST